MNDELKEKYLELLQRLKISANVDSFGDDKFSLNHLFQINTSDGIPIRKLFIANLAERTTYKDLENVFSKYGELDGCYLQRNANKKNYAFVTFRDPQKALNARLDGHNKKIRIHNRDLRVFPADSWHQPESIECQNKLAQLKNKIQLSEDFIEDDSDTEQDRSLISKLNDDCLMHIFQFLPIPYRVRIERVCKRWRTVSLNSWHSFRKLDVSSLSQKCDTLSNYFVDKSNLRKVLLRCGQFLTEITCSGEIFSINQNPMSIITKLCPNIQKIDLSGITMTPSGIDSLTKTYNNLKEVKLGACSYCCDNDLKHLFQGNPNLKKFEISTDEINGSCLIALPESLEELSLQFCDGIVCNNFCEAIQRLKMLKHLTIISCVRMYDSALEELSKCQEINSVVLNGNFHMLSSKGMKNIANMTNLKELNLEDCKYLVTNDLLVELSLFCVNLINININECKQVTEEGVAPLFTLPNLQHLSMISLSSVSNFFINISNIPLKLKTLNCEQMFDLSEKSVCILIESAPDLELLILNKCSKITNRLLEVAVRCTKKRTNNTLLKIEVCATSVNTLKMTEISPLLHIVHLKNISNYDLDY